MSKDRYLSILVVSHCGWSLDFDYEALKYCNFDFIQDEEPWGPRQPPLLSEIIPTYSGSGGNLSVAYLSRGH